MQQNMVAKRVQSQPSLNIDLRFRAFLALLRTCHLLALAIRSARKGNAGAKEGTVAHTKNILRPLAAPQMVSVQ